MKHVFLSLAMLSLIACTAQDVVLTIPANQSVEIDFPQYALWMASLHNKSMQQIEVIVTSKSGNDTIRTFGLNRKGKADVTVERNNKLNLVNLTSQTINISMAVSAQNPAEKKIEESSTYRSFTLQNTSANSIPLIIPNVMNPNLSPFSKSGVDLKIGQEILFKEKGKKYVLLVVEDAIENGATIDVAALLKKRKEELALN